jgi:hypothetical protein
MPVFSSARMLPMTNVDGWHRLILIGRGYADF